MDTDELVKAEETEVDGGNRSRDSNIEEERLSTRRNHFPSYSNDDVSVRFRVNYFFLF